MSAKNKKGRKVVLHQLDEGSTRSFRFLDQKTNDFIEACPPGKKRSQATKIAEANGLRSESIPKETS